MSKRQEAVNELFDGFLSRYGDTPQNRKTIKGHIVSMVRSKSRITVTDIDNLEKQIKVAMQSPLKVEKTPRSLSRMHNPTDFSFSHSKTPKVHRVLPLDSIKTRQNTRDHSLPANNFEPSPRGNSSLRVDFLSKVKLKHVNDEWGKLIKNDSIKFNKEQDMMRTQAKLQQRNYFNDLFKQSCLNKHKSNVRKREQEMMEKEFVEKLCSDIENKTKESQQQKLMQTTQQKTELGNFLEEKKVKKSKISHMKQIEKQQLNQDLSKYFHQETQSRFKKFSQMKEIAGDNFMSSSNLKSSKFFEKKEEMAQDYEHLMTNYKLLNESEIKYKKIVDEKRSKAHDVERLEKLIMIKPKNLKQMEEEDDLKEKLRTQMIVEEEKTEAMKKIEKKKLSKKVISGALERQISEKKLLSELYKSLDTEQGLINKIVDEKTAIEDQEKLRKKKKLQNEMHVFYSKQIQDKLESEISDFHLSNIEKMLNKEIINEAL